MKIGIIVANEYEQKAFWDVFGIPVMRNLGNGTYDVAQWKLRDRFIYLILSGIGEIAAASATQYLIDTFAVDKVINYGVAGSLSEEHQERKVGIVTSVVHYDFDATFGTKYRVGEYQEQGLFLKPQENAIPTAYTKHLNHFICASADKLVGGGEPKRRLNREFGADICEMEAAGVLITCNRNRIPCTIIKAVSDGVDGDIEAFDNNVDKATKACVKLIAEFI